VRATIEQELGAMSEDEVLVITGSFFIMADVRVKLGLTPNTSEYIDFI
jgi:hypothetical protein